jgi:hypothetical protein
MSEDSNKLTSADKISGDKVNQDKIQVGINSGAINIYHNYISSEIPDNYHKEPEINNILPHYLQNSFVAVDSRPLIGTNGRIIRITLDKYELVAEFLDDIFFALEGHVPPYTYGDTWILQDKNTGNTYEDIASGWGERRDVRTLEEAGILSGMTLNVIFPPGKRKPFSR